MRSPRSCPGASDRRARAARARGERRNDACADPSTRPRSSRRPEPGGSLPPWFASFEVDARVSIVRHACPSCPDSGRGREHGVRAPEARGARRGGDPVGRHRAGRATRERQGVRRGAAGVQPRRRARMLRARLRVPQRIGRDFQGRSACDTPLLEGLHRERCDELRVARTCLPRRRGRDQAGCDGREEVLREGVRPRPRSVVPTGAVEERVLSRPPFERRDRSGHLGAGRPRRVSSPFA